MAPVLGLASATFGLVAGGAIGGPVGRYLIERYRLVDAAVSRLRPVFLAAATTVLGVIPLLPHVFWVGRAVTIMAGPTIGTCFTMIVGPVLYATFYGIPARQAARWESPEPTGAAPMAAGRGRHRLAGESDAAGRCTGGKSAARPGVMRYRFGLASWAGLMRRRRSGEAVTGGKVMAQRLLAIAGFSCLLSSGVASPGAGHDWYTGLTSSAGVACCGSGECRPAAARYNERTGTWETEVIENTWLPVPPGALAPIPSPDGAYHVCEYAGTIRCFFQPGQVKRDPLDGAKQRDVADGQSRFHHSHGGRTMQLDQELAFGSDPSRLQKYPTR